MTTELAHLKPDSGTFDQADTPGNARRRPAEELTLREETRGSAATCVHENLDPILACQRPFPLRFAIFLSFGSSCRQLVRTRN